MTFSGGVLPRGRSPGFGSPVTFCSPLCVFRQELHQTFKYVHHDVKPANLCLPSDQPLADLPHLVLIDLALACENSMATGAPQAPLAAFEKAKFTVQKAVSGTALYASFGQHTGSQYNLGFADDLESFLFVLWNLACGGTPWCPDPSQPCSLATVRAKQSAHLTCPVPLLRALFAHVRATPRYHMPEYDALLALVTAHHAHVPGARRPRTSLGGQAGASVPQPAAAAAASAAVAAAVVSVRRPRSPRGAPVSPAPVGARSSPRLAKRRMPDHEPGDEEVVRPRGRSRKHAQ